MPNVSFEAIDLIKQLCSWDPLRRPTAEQTLRHPFFHMSTRIPRTVRDPFELKLNSMAPGPDLELKLWDFGNQTDDCFLGLTLAVNPSLPNLELSHKVSNSTTGEEVMLYSGFQEPPQHSGIMLSLSSKLILPKLRSLLIRKVIFTNVDKVHAAKALKRLGLEDCFEGIICFETLNPIHKNTISDDEDDIEFVGAVSPPASFSNKEIFDIVKYFSQANPGSVLPKTPIVCKPSEDAIERALRIGNIDPRRTLFFEDSVRNVQSGKRLGLDTVLVGTSHRVKGADYSLESIHNIREALPELWDSDKKPEVTFSVAVETPVTT